MLSRFKPNFVMKYKVFIRSDKASFIGMESSYFAAITLRCLGIDIVYC
ncbi:hypothetical protein AQPE_0623 [Aquipluma nitroreducens]|uniref:Uncharacterized protein n=1 Tax=Aquipluma nitroreducens TaxID=2010828 RepID=A0A5K7S556_9BACT|nr:hypothetical protein AQPE_0623 [Aquipluma nitroreducens]